jgi:hypothetical protein
MSENFPTSVSPGTPSEPNSTVTPASQTYSAFYPVLAVLIALAAVHASYINSDLKERLQLKRALVELAPTLPQAARITKIAEDLGKDLVTLAGANDAEAAKIVTEFNIKTNRPAAPTASAPAPAAH